MRFVESIVFRELTNAEFFNINKPRGTERRGGGQSYIDFPLSAITIENWKSFFKSIASINEPSGPKWTFTINSLGTTKGNQEVTISQRRPSSVSIRSQKLASSQSNRIYAWRPDLTGFPEPPEPQKHSHIHNLHVYITKLDNDEYWAGWFHIEEPEQNWPINEMLNRMFVESTGYLQFDNNVAFEPTDDTWPFRIVQDKGDFASTTKNKIIQEDAFFDEDEILPQNALPKTKELIRKVRIRNSKAVKKLKILYNNQCQISGSKYTFKKTNGDYYSEGHHLVPLGEGGADSVYNMVILSPLIHRMMHYAKVEDFDLRNIKNNKLSIIINNTTYTITWHPDHAKIVEESSL